MRYQILMNRCRIWKYLGKYNLFVFIIFKYLTFSAWGSPPIPSKIQQSKYPNQRYSGRQFLRFQMRIFKAVLAGLAGLAAAQTDVLARQYDPMRTSPIGSLKSCEINNLQAICTCDWQSLPKQQNRPTPAPQKPRVVYMFPANGDSGSNGLYYYMKSFASYMMQNEQAGEIYDYR